MKVESTTALQFFKNYCLERLKRVTITKLLTLSFIGIGVFLLLNKELSLQFSLTPPLKGAIEFVEFPYRELEDLDSKEMKREQFLKTPNVAFHYADKIQIQNFYQEYFREPIIEKRVEEVTAENAQNGKGNLDNMLSAEASKSAGHKRISTLKYPETTINGMFLRYQKEMIRQHQVTIGLEELDIELENLKSFNLVFERLESEFGFVDIDREKIKQHEDLLKAKAAEKTLETLQNASDWVIIKGNFLLQWDEGFYRLTLEHPVNQFLQQKEKIRISTMIPQTAIESSFLANYKNSLGSRIPVTIYGKVWKPIDREQGHFDLEITALAIY